MGVGAVWGGGVPGYAGEGKVGYSAAEMRRRVGLWARVVEEQVGRAWKWRVGREMGVGKGVGAGVPYLRSDGMWGLRARVLGSWVVW